MEIILDKKGKKKLFLGIDFRTSRIVKILFGFVILCTVSLVSMYYGAKIYRSGKVGSINYKIHDFSVTKLNFIPNYFKGIFSKPDEFVIDIKFEDLQKIRNFRNSAFAAGDRISAAGKEDNVSAKLTYQNKTYKVKIGLTGTTLRHIADPEKWSYRIKVKDDGSILRMKEFNLLYPTARGYLSDWIGHRLQEKLGLIALRYYFVNVIINGKDLGLYCLEENYDKILVENNEMKEGLVFKWGELPDIYNEGKLDPEIRKKSQVLRSMVKGFNINDIAINQLFDLRKMAKHFALNDLLNGGHHGVSLGNTRYYLNPTTNLIEPIGREWLITTNKYKSSEKALTIEILQDAPFFNKFFYNPEFVNLYVNELKALSESVYLDQFFEEEYDEIEKFNNVIYRDNPFYIYPKEILYENQTYIKSKISPIQTVAAYNSGYSDSVLHISARNLQCLPIKINNIKLGDSLIFKPLPAQSFIAGNNETYSIYEIENRKSYSKFDQLDFKISTNSFSENVLDQLTINYNLIGMDSVYTDNVFPWKYERDPLLAYNFTQQSPNIQKFKFLSVDSQIGTITFNSGDVNISSDMIIPDGYKVFINANTTINLIDSALIISYSPIRFYGSPDNPILIHSSDSTGQGIFVLNTSEKSYLNYTHFKNLCNPVKKGWDISGAIVFYNADVSINECIFLNNFRGDDFLNIISSMFDISNTLFKDIYADAFDSDFSKGRISYSSFLNCGNDGIDISGTDLYADNILMDNIGDKGLSAGENSIINAEKISINNSEISICSKDKSTITISEVVLQNNKIGFNAFEKKTEFGTGHIVATKVEIDNVSIPYLIENLSSCIIDGIEIVTNNENVKDILYGVQYGKSSN